MSTQHSRTSEPSARIVDSGIPDPNAPGFGQPYQIRRRVPGIIDPAVPKFLIKLDFSAVEARIAFDKMTREYLYLTHWLKLQQQRFAMSNFYQVTLSMIHENTRVEMPLLFQGEPSLKDIHDALGDKVNGHFVLEKIRCFFRQLNALPSGPNAGFYDSERNVFDYQIKRLGVHQTKAIRDIKNRVFQEAYGKAMADSLGTEVHPKDAPPPGYTERAAKLKAEQVSEAAVAVGEPIFTGAEEKGKDRSYYDEEASVVIAADKVALKRSFARALDKMTAAELNIARDSQSVWDFKTDSFVMVLPRRAKLDPTTGKIGPRDVAGAATFDSAFKRRDLVNRFHAALGQLTDDEVEICLKQSVILQAYPKEPKIFTMRRGSRDSVKAGLDKVAKRNVYLRRFQDILGDIRDNDLHNFEEHYLVIDLMDERGKLVCWSPVFQPQDESSPRRSVQLAEQMNESAKAAKEQGSSFPQPTDSQLLNEEYLPDSVIRMTVNDIRLENPPDRINGHVQVIADGTTDYLMTIESFGHYPTDDEIINRFRKRGLMVPNPYYQLWIVKNGKKTKWKPGFTHQLRVVGRTGRFYEFMLKQGENEDVNHLFACYRVAGADPKAICVIRPINGKGRYDSPYGRVPNHKLWNLTGDGVDFWWTCDKPKGRDIRLAFRQADKELAPGSYYILRNPAYEKFLFVPPNRQGIYSLTVEHGAAVGCKTFTQPPNDSEITAYINSLFGAEIREYKVKVWRPNGDYCHFLPGSPQVLLTGGGRQPERSDWMSF